MPGSDGIVLFTILLEGKMLSHHGAVHVLRAIPQIAVMEAAPI
jgi:hypothetical protein